MATLSAAGASSTCRHTVESPDEETSRDHQAASEGGFISQWSWSAEGRVVFDLYDGGKWRLMAMTTGGEIAEIGEAVQGEDVDSPFALIQH